LWATGSGQNGRLGTGNTASQTSPIQIATGVSSVTAGAGHTLFIKSDGTLWGMGWNNTYQLGTGGTTNVLSPQQLATGVVAAAAGNGHSVFIKTDGTLWGMGYGTWIGSGLLSYAMTPLQVASGVATVDSGNFHTLFIKTDGSVWGMGDNTHIQIVNTAGVTYASVPTLVFPASAGVTAISAGGNHSLVLAPPQTAQTISFGALSLRTFGEPPFAVSATATSSLPVTFSVVSGPATISGSTVTLTGTGTVTIRASQAGNLSYAAATPVDRSFTVAASQTITFGALSDRYFVAGTFTVAATASSGLPVTFSIASGPATISGNTISLTGTGAVTVRASQAGNVSVPAATPVDRTFNVTTAPAATAGYLLQSNQVADVVLGQADFTTFVPQGSSYGLSLPAGVAWDPGTGKVFVADTTHNRVLRYGSAAAAQVGGAPEAVLGQMDFTGANNNQGGAPSASSMAFPTGLCLDAKGRLWVADAANQRVLGFFRPAEISNGAPADLVLGQPNFNSSGNAATQSGMEGPVGVTVGPGDTLWVAEAYRVLRFDNVSGKSNGAPADGVLGQPNFTSYTPATTASGLKGANGIWAGPTGRLWVADAENNRVLRFDNAAAKANGAAADGVLGQFNFTSSTAAAGAAALNRPYGVYLDEAGALWVSDSFNSRVVRFPAAGTLANGGSADLVLGQPDLSTVQGFHAFSAQDIIGPNQLGPGPAGSLLVVDGGANRVLRFSPIAPPGVATHFSLTGLTGNATTGVAINNVTLTALDASEQVVTGYVGTVRFTSTDSALTPIADYTFGSGDAGAHTFAVTFNTAGNQTLTATDTANSAINVTSAAVTVDTTTAQTITFSPPGIRLFGDAPFTLTATASSGLPVSFSVVSGPATLIGNVVTLTGTGSVTIRASQVGDLTYAAAPAVDQTFTVAPQPTRGPAEYRVTDLGTLSGEQSTASGINQDGVVVGTVITSSGYFRAARWTDDGAGNRDLGALDIYGSLAVAINDRGEIAGASYKSLGNATPARAARYDGLGGVTDLGTLGGSTSEVSAINNGVTTATLVGTAQMAGDAVYRAVRFGTPNFDLGTLDGRAESSSYAAGINDSGIIVGYGSTATSPSRAIRFSGTGSGNFDLGALGGNISDANAINNAGHIVGEAQRSDGEVHATRFSGTGVDADNIDLGTLGGQSTAFAINEAGKIVGSSGIPDSLPNAFIYAGGVISNLNAKIGSAPGWVLLEARGINDAGQIAATGRNSQGKTHALLLTPIETTGAATHFSVSAPSSVTTGDSRSVTITALDSANNVVANYPGVVRFTSSDATDHVPNMTSMASGTVTVTFTFGTTGNRTITATDTVDSTITGVSGLIVVTPASPPATHFVLTGLPSSGSTGSPYSVNVTPVDANNQTVANYTGRVHLTSSDGSAVLPADYRFTGSETGHAFSVTFNTPGNQTVTATDTVTSTITSTSAPVAVSSPTSTVTHFSVEGPASAYVGQQVSYRVTALDAANQVVPTYAGSVRVTSSDSSVPLVGSPVLSSGTGLFYINFGTEGSKTVSAVESGNSAITGTSAPVLIGRAPTHFSITEYPYLVSANAPFTFKVTALDAADRVATTYSGTVHFEGSVYGSYLPGDTTLTNGVGVFTAAFNATGNVSFRVMDALFRTITSPSASMFVLFGATHFAVADLPTTAVTGSSVAFRVVALNSAEQQVVYNGLVRLYCTDSSAIFSSNPVLSSGEGIFRVIFNSPGSHTVSVGEPVSSYVQGVSTPVTVTVAPAPTPSPTPDPVPPVVTSPPVITRQPASVRVATGGTATFFVAATGEPAPGYQWYYKGSPIPGATSSTLTLNAVIGLAAGDYWVNVFNRGGLVRSSTVSLAVTTPGVNQVFLSPRTGTPIAVSRNGAQGVLSGAVNGVSFVLRFLLQADGSFDLAVAPGDVVVNERERIAADVVGGAIALSGRIVDGVLTLLIRNTGEQVVIAAEPTTGSTAGLAGFYEVPLMNGGVGSANFFVGANGQMMVGLVQGGKTEVAAGTAGTDGRFNATLSSGAMLSGTIDAGSGALHGTLRTRTGETLDLVGLSAGLESNDRLVNLSTRGAVGDNDKIMIAGFVITGSEPKSVLIRAAGPALTKLGLNAPMENPTLTLFSGGQAIGSNDDWSVGNGAAVAEAATRVGAFPFDAGSKDSAILTNLAPGPYTAQVSRAAGSANGVALVEVYDASSSPSAEAQKLVNISSRGEVRTGGDVMIAGFVVTGNAPRKLLIRGVGPTLAKLGVSGVLANPVLQLYQGSTPIFTNDDWGTGDSSTLVAPAAAQVGAFALDVGSKDAALLVTLAPGVYTAQVSGADGGTGIALIEVYEVP
jgi:probable HAF family extracellular repeat protein